jgi:hypothetical protein
MSFGSEGVGPGLVMLKGNYPNQLCSYFKPYITIVGGNGTTQPYNGMTGLPHSERTVENSVLT